MAGASVYSSALENISDGCTLSALATRSKLSAVTLRSPRSIFPMWERSIPALCANASWDTPRAFRTSRIARPNAFRRKFSSSVRGLLDTRAPFPKVHYLATVFTTHFFVEVIYDNYHGYIEGEQNEHFQNFADNLFHRSFSICSNTFPNRAAPHASLEALHRELWIRRCRHGRMLRRRIVGAGWQAEPSL